jgi:NADP-dependent aldehyde dehydrogenase
LEKLLSIQITGDPIIGGIAAPSSEKGFRATNPSTGEVLSPAFALATPADVDRACRLAAEAFDAYRSASLEVRASFLERIADNIEAVGPELLERAVEETGLPKFRLQGEFARTVNQLRLFARVVRSGEWLDLRVDEAMPDRQPLPRPDIRLRQIGLGPVAVFGSSNFPFAFSVAGGDTASALAAGCPVVVKGHLAHPGTGELAGRAVRKAVIDSGLPEGVFALLPGANETGAALVAHPAIKAVGFTGSRAGGIALCEIAAKRKEPIPVYAEMSSVNPVFLFPSALKKRTEELAAGFVGSLTVGAGQLCTNPGILVAVDGEDLDAFVAVSADLVSKSEAGPMLSSGIHAAFDRGVEALHGNSGVQRVAVGKSSGEVNRSPATFFETTVREFISDPRLAEEVFGASSLLIRCKSLAEFAELAESLEGQLTATIHIDEDDYRDASQLVPVLERKVGRILANGWPTGVEVSDAMVHGGPFPATSDSRTTSVGTMAIRRFLRPVSYQNLPIQLLPQEVGELSSTLPRLVNGRRKEGEVG